MSTSHALLIQKFKLRTEEKKSIRKSGTVMMIYDKKTKRKIFLLFLCCYADINAHRFHPDPAEQL